MQNLSNRTDYLYRLGILGDLRDDTEKRNQWLKSQWEEYDPNFRSIFPVLHQGIIIGSGHH